MSDVFKQEFYVRWADLDPNFHVRHTVYADLCATTRFKYLDSIGFTAGKFAQLKVGPILFSENINYLSEVRAGDQIVVNVQVSGLSQDGRKWKMHHELFKKSDGKLAATIEITGAWFDLVNRKVTVPPSELLDKMQEVPRSKDFKVL
jgi:acyl-CoA thioester hydrolase